MELAVPQFPSCSFHFYESLIPRLLGIRFCSFNFLRPRFVSFLEERKKDGRSSGGEINWGRWIKGWGLWLDWVDGGGVRGSGMGAYILKASLVTPTFPQKKFELSANLSKNASKWPKNGQKWPQMVQSGPNMTQNGPKWPKNDPKWSKMAQKWHNMV